MFDFLQKVTVKSCTDKEDAVRMCACVRSLEKMFNTHQDNARDTQFVNGCRKHRQIHVLEVSGVKKKSETGCNDSGHAAVQMGARSADEKTSGRVLEAEKNCVDKIEGRRWRSTRNKIRGVCYEWCTVRKGWRVSL